MSKYPLPPFLAEILVPEVYERWLRRKAQAHVRRDRMRGNRAADGESYRRAIHDAVVECGGLDAYTGEELRWNLLSKYDNHESSERGRHYKRDFALLPTVDHVGDGTGPADFKICGWRTNDAKNDLALPEFLLLCESVLKHHGYAVDRTDR